MQENSVAASGMNDFGGSSRISPVIERVSILITAFKNPELVKQCVDSLLKMYGGRLPETVIVDDAAGDVPTAELVSSYAPYGVKYAVMPKNGGFAGANNFGYPLCTKEYVVLVNSDTVFEEDPFAAMVAFMDAHPKAGVISGKIVVRNDDPSQNGRLNGAGSMMTQYGVMSTRGWMADPNDPQWNEPARVFTAYGALFMFRNGLHEKVGGTLFYDHFHTYYEEVDLCHRTWLAGMEVWYVPTPIVYHAHGATMGKFYTRESVLRKYYRNIRFSFRTCWGLRGRLTIMPVFALLCLGQIVAQLLRGNTMALKTHWGAHVDLWKMRGEVRKVRKTVQGFRVRSDRELMDNVIRRLTIKEFLHIVRGNV